MKDFYGLVSVRRRRSCKTVGGHKPRQPLLC